MHQVRYPFKPFNGTAVGRPGLLPHRIARPGRLILPTLRTRYGVGCTVRARFGTACTETVLSLFALMGMCLLVLPLQNIVVLIRYRSMIPFMYLSLLVVLIGSRAIQSVHPLVRTSTLPYGVIMNLTILAVAAVGFVLSLHDKRKNTQ